MSNPNLLHISAFLLFCLTFFSIALPTYSIIIQEQKRNLFSTLSSPSFHQQFRHQLQPHSRSILVETYSNQEHEQDPLIQSPFTFPPFQKPEGLQRLEALGSKIKKFNLNVFERGQNGLPSNNPDEGDLVYTSDLQILSSLGIQTGTKLMDFIRSTIEKNRKIIFQHNWSHRKSYTLAENKFVIYTPQEFRQMYLTLKEPSDGNGIQDKSQQVSPVRKNIRSLQASQNPNASEVTVNWRTARKMTSVKFQQTCGSCYSFTPVAAIESAFMIYKNWTVNLAEQQVVDCSNPYENYGCVGGWNANSYRYIKDFGIVHESSYPYRADFGDCKLPSNPFKYRIKDFVEVQNDCKAVIEALKEQPLSIAVNSEGWMYYSSGIYTDCRTGGSNHGVVLAGVDQSSWLIKNSWGFTWGQNGYMRISRNSTHDCNVCRWASYPVLD